MHLSSCLHLPATHSTISICKAFWLPSTKLSTTFSRRIVQLNFQVSSCFLLPQVGGRHARTSLRARGGEQVDVKAWLAFRSRPLVVDADPVPIDALKWTVTHTETCIKSLRLIKSPLVFFGFRLEYFVCAHNMDNQQFIASPSSKQAGKAAQLTDPAKKGQPCRRGRTGVRMGQFLLP